MEAATAAISRHTSRKGHFTNVDEVVRPAVTLETVKPHRHEVVTEAIDKEIHQHHHHTTVVPLTHKETLPTKHTHNLVPIRKVQHQHENPAETQRALAELASHFRDTLTTLPTVHSKSEAPRVVGEHYHHHVHEIVQPVIYKETIQQEHVHTTIPIHEVHHVVAKHHGLSALPIKPMEEFMKFNANRKADHVTQSKFDGAPRPYDSKLSTTFEKLGFHHPHAGNRGVNDTDTRGLNQPGTHGLNHSNTLGQPGMDGTREPGVLGMGQQSTHGTHGINQTGTHGLNTNTRELDQPGVHGLGHNNAHGMNQTGIGGLNNTQNNGLNRSGIDGLNNTNTGGLNQSGAFGRHEPGVLGRNDPGMLGRNETGVLGLNQPGTHGLNNSNTRGVHQPGVLGMNQPGTTGLNSNTYGLNEPGNQGLNNTNNSGITQPGVLGMTRPGTHGTNPLTSHGTTEGSHVPAAINTNPNAEHNDRLLQRKPTPPRTPMLQQHDSRKHRRSHGRDTMSPVSRGSMSSMSSASSVSSSAPSTPNSPSYRRTIGGPNTKTTITSSTPIHSTSSGPLNSFSTTQGPIATTTSSAPFQSGSTGPLNSRTTIHGPAGVTTDTTTNHQAGYVDNSLPMTANKSVLANEPVQVVGADESPRTSDENAYPTRQRGSFMSRFSGQRSNSGTTRRY